MRHVMLGLPGESRDDMLATAKEVSRLGFDAVKIHNLYAVHNTRWPIRWLPAKCNSWNATPISKLWSHS